MSSIDDFNPAVAAVEHAVAVEIRREQLVELDGDADVLRREQLADRVEIGGERGIELRAVDAEFAVRSALMPISPSMSNGPLETADVRGQLAAQLVDDVANAGVAEQAARLLCVSTL